MKLDKDYPTYLDYPEADEDSSGILGVALVWLGMAVFFAILYTLVG